MIGPKGMFRPPAENPAPDVPNDHDLARCDGRQRRSGGGDWGSGDRQGPATRPALRHLRRRECGAAGAGRLSARPRDIDVPSLRRDGADGRQAEPGAAQGPLEVVDVAADRGGQERRGRCRGLGRQYRRADGDGEVLPEARMAGIDRPAIAAIWPTLRGESIVLDVGATIGADAGNWSTSPSWAPRWRASVFGLERPTVGLLNVGVEEIKGVEEVQARPAGILSEMNHRRVRISRLRRRRRHRQRHRRRRGHGRLCRQYRAEDRGRHGAADRRVSARGDGADWARGSAISSPTALPALRDKMDPRKVNGGVFLGLNGLVIKSHGGTDAEGFASAIDLAHEMAKNDLVRIIAEDRVLQLRAPPEPQRAEAASA